MADLVIVGGGTAGLAAAVTAGELGVDTLVIEKTDRLGGQLHWSSGHFSAAGSRRQAERGVEDTAGEHRRDIDRIGHGRATPHLVDLAVANAGAMTDWLEGLDFDFADETPAFVGGHELYSKPRTYWGGPTPRSGGPALYAALIPALERHPSVVVRTGASVRTLHIEDGRVRGVVLDDGSVVEADHVVLATGGYAASRDLVAELQPEHAAALTGCLPHSTGDGLSMLRDLDVPLTHTDTYVPTMGLVEDPGRPGFAFNIGETRVIVNALERTPAEIWVNRAGERFVDEATPSPFHREERLLAQPDLMMAVVWDDETFRTVSPVIGPEWTHDAMETAAAQGRWLHRTDRLEDLASRLGVDPRGLEATVERWNRGDDPFDRPAPRPPILTPPFWGVRSVGGMLLSRGGPTVDGLLRPVRIDGTVVEGVHCVGELLGMGQFSGDSFAGGMSVGPALTLGRWIVQHLYD